ncbi:hypothetical protein [Pontibacter brevis]
MSKISASEKSDLTLIAALFFLLLLYIAHNAYVGKEVPAQPQGGTKAVIAAESPCLTQF